MPITERDGHRIYYEVSGDPAAPPLLLIMGLGLSSRGWGQFPARLGARFRVLTFDNRGTGRSIAPHAPVFDMADLADDAAAVLDAAGVAQAFVFGISMGGMIAQELVLRHPGRVAALVLGATFADWLRSIKPLGAALELMVINAGARDAPRLARLLTGPAFAELDRLSSWFRAAEPAPRGRALLQMLAVLRHSTTARLGDVRVPTLVLTGDGDRLVPPANSHVLARLIPRARLVVLEKVGHLIPLEREDLTVRLLEEHFFEV